MYRSTLTLLACLAFAACGPSAGNGNLGGSSFDLSVADLRAATDMARSDARVVDLATGDDEDLSTGTADLATRPDLAGVDCPAPQDYASPGLVSGEASSFTDDDGNDSVFWTGELNGGSELLILELYAGLGKLAGAKTIKTGTYTLDGPEVQYQSCGVCLRVGADLDVGGQPQAFYMATGGTISLTSVNGTLKATITNATFEHVTIDPSDYTSTPVGDGCQSAVQSVTVNETIEPF